jgi:hypothetical protein
MKLAQPKTRSPRSGKNKRQNRTPQTGNKNSFFIEIQIVYSSKSQRSPPSLPHLIISNINFRSWLTNPRLKTKNVRSGEITISLLPLGPIYRTNQLTKMPIQVEKEITAKEGYFGPISIMSRPIPSYHPSFASLS